MRIFLVVLIFFSNTGISFAENRLSKEEVNNLFFQAKSFFKEANEKGNKDLYLKAAMRIERIISEGGIKNGKLYYNLGNIYFLMDDIGQAVLNYRRAERLIPSDANLRQNLEFALSKRKDKIDEKERTKVLKTLLFWHYDIPLTVRSKLFVLFLALFWLGITIRLFSDRIIPRWIPVSAGILGVMFLTSCMAGTIFWQTSKRGVILAKEVTARKGNGKNYRKSFTEPLHAGTDFIFVEKREDWLQIELMDGRRCWIQEKYAGLL